MPVILRVNFKYQLYRRYLSLAQILIPRLAESLAGRESQSNLFPHALNLVSSFLFVRDGRGGLSYTSRPNGHSRGERTNSKANKPLLYIKSHVMI